jgi:hypothetical protein
MFLATRLVQDGFCFLIGFVLAMCLLIPLFSDYTFDIGKPVRPPQNIHRLKTITKPFGLFSLTSITLFQDQNDNHFFVFGDKETQDKVVLEWNVSGEDLEPVWEIPRRIMQYGPPKYVTTPMKDTWDALRCKNKAKLTEFFEKYNYFLHYLADMLWKDYRNPFIPQIKATDFTILLPQTQGFKSIPLTKDTTVHLKFQGIRSYKHSIQGVWTIASYTQTIAFEPYTFKNKASEHYTEQLGAFEKAKLLLEKTTVAWLQT